jgi:hypothetical protein
MDFELVIKVIVLAVAAVGIPVGAYAAIAATRAIWIKGEPGKLGADDLQSLQDRVAELESQVARIAELEERVDFAERMLARREEPHQLGPGRGA